MRNKLAIILVAAGLQAGVFSAIWLAAGTFSISLVSSIVLLTIWLVAEAVCCFRYADQPGRRESGDRFCLAGGFLILTSLVLAALGLMRVDPWSGTGEATAIPSGGAWIMALGWGIGLAGVGLRCAAIAKLGKFFHNDVELSAGQQRVTTGIYRFLRHPSELGTVLATVGICISALSPVATIFALTTLSPLAIFRAHCENLLLERELGNRQCGQSIEPVLSGAISPSKLRSSPELQVPQRHRGRPFRTLT